MSAGVDILRVAERHAPEVVYLALKDALAALAVAERERDTLRAALEDLVWAASNRVPGDGGVDLEDAREALASVSPEGEES